METLRYSFEILTKQFIEEQTRENFVTPSTPGPNDYKWAAPYFTKYGITPEEAFKVLIDFDKEPKDLTQDDLNIRIRALAALDCDRQREIEWRRARRAGQEAPPP